LTEIITADLMAHSKLADFRLALLALNPAGLRAIAERVTSVERSGQLGPVAVVVRSELAYAAPGRAIGHTIE
jgi:hypothetical protein